MDRRNFIAGVGTGAALTGAPLVAAPTQHKPAAAPAAKGPLRMKLGCQSGPADDDHFAFLARYGVTNVAARAKVSEGRLYSTVDELLEVRRLAERHQLAFDILDPVWLASTHVDKTSMPSSN